MRLNGAWSWTEVCSRLVGCRVPLCSAASQLSAADAADADADAAEEERRWPLGGRSGNASVSAPFQNKCWSICIFLFLFCLSVTVQCYMNFEYNVLDWNPNKTKNWRYSTVLLIDSLMENTEQL